MALDYLQGKVKIDEYVTHSRTLADINEGFEDMHVCIRLCSLPARADNPALCRKATVSVAWLTCHRQLAIAIRECRLIGEEAVAVTLYYHTNSTTVLRCTSSEAFDRRPVFPSRLAYMLSKCKLFVTSATYILHDHIFLRSRISYAHTLSCTSSNTIPADVHVKGESVRSLTRTHLLLLFPLPDGSVSYPCLCSQRTALWGWEVLSPMGQMSRWDVARFVSQPTHPSPAH